MPALADPKIQEPQPWSPRRWAIFVVAIFGIHAGLVVFLSRPATGLQPKHSEASSLRLLANPQEALVARRLSVLNPALFGTANPRNFSGLAWIRRPASEFQISSWTEPPAYLQLSERIAWVSPGENASAMENWLAEKLAPSLAEPVLAPTTGSSRLQVEQLPGGRALRGSAALPVQVYTDVLSNSVVQAAVDGYGAVISARLISRSGSKKADANAVSIAKLARFQPKTRMDFDSDARALPEWATLVFQWFTAEPELSKTPKK